jgi:DNA-binding PadR family transcriptional regulator
MFEISNAEYMLCALIREGGKASGYRLNTVIRERGYREWADIGMTSIYGGLKKLECKGLISGQRVRRKTTQGPAAVEYGLTVEGARLLKEETEKGLSGTRERDRRFDLALSAIDVVSRDKSRALIGKRKAFLESEYERMKVIFAGERARVSAAGILLFGHTFHLLKSEIAYLEGLMREWGKGK